MYGLSDLGAVITHSARGRSQDGLDAEWYDINLLTLDGELINRCELFNETDIDAALARFEQLSRSAPPLENVASQVAERFWRHFAATDPAATSEMLAVDVAADDRRPVVNSGLRRGRDAVIKDMYASADFGIRIAPSVVATRGQRVALIRTRYTGRDQRPEAFVIDVLHIFEIDADERIAALVMFELDDIDAAFAELEARYLAGEAAAYASVWRIALDILDEANRHEPGPVLARLAYSDHRRVPFGHGKFGQAVEELWTLVPDAQYRVTTAHALDARGAVVSLVIEGTDAHGNQLQWARTILLDADEPRLEVYEEGDVKAALTRFEELRPRARKLENAASRVDDRR